MKFEDTIKKSSFDIYEKDTDKFLCEIAMLGAFYGLINIIGPILEYLKEKPRTKGVSFIAAALGKITISQYDIALQLLNSVLRDPSMTKFSKEATEFTALIYKLKGDDENFEQIARSISTPLIDGLKVQKEIRKSK